MNRLLINVGNSRTVAVLANRRGEVTQEVLVRPTPRTELEAEALAVRLAAERPPDLKAGITSVVPLVTAALELNLPDLQVVDHNRRMPFEVAVDEAETVGADRWCNVAAAVDAGLTDALVVDAGTATTIDVLTDGVFVGGLIAPGMAFAAQALQEMGARLWTVPFEPVELRPGRDTEEALQIGAFHVGVHGVKGTVLELLEQYPGARVVLTGGLGHFLRHDGWVLEPQWTFRGLTRLLNG